MHLFCLFSHSFSAKFKWSNNSLRCSINWGLSLWSAFTQIFCWVQWQPSLWWKGWVLSYAEIQYSQSLSCTIIYCLVKYHAEGGAGCCLNQYHSLHKLSGPGSVNMNRSILKVIRSMVYLLEYSYSFADAIRSDRTSSFSIMDNRNIVLLFSLELSGVLSTLLNRDPCGLWLNYNENYLCDLD